MGSLTTPLDRVQAVVMLYLPGNFGVVALADVSGGSVNPSGRLPFTYPRWLQGLLPYWHKRSEEVDVNARDPTASHWGAQWESGSGLSYTVFQYQDLVLSSGCILRSGETMDMSVMVMNPGTTARKEVMMLFTSDLVVSSTPEAKRLRKFRKLELQPGRS
jgi:beta-glucosidase